MAYIDDIVMTTETFEDHMERFRDGFDCLRAAGFKMRVSKCGFMMSEIKYLVRVVSAEGFELDSNAVAKLRDCDVPETERHICWGLQNIAVMFSMAAFITQLLCSCHNFVGGGK